MNQNVRSDAKNSTKPTNRSDAVSALSDLVLLDISWFSKYPTHTGIQRQLEAFIRHKGNRKILTFAIEDDVTVRVFPEFLLDVIREFFTIKHDSLSDARVHYHGGARGTSSLSMIIRSISKDFGKLCAYDDLFSQARAIFITEYILEESYLDFYLKSSAKYGFKTFFIEHDLVFWRLRSHYSKVKEHIGYIKHLHLMRRAPNVGCVSKAVRNDLYQVVRRDPFLPAVVITPGGDSIGESGPTTLPDVLRVSVVGTIEPRKRSEMILDVLERLNQTLPLEAVFCGSISSLCAKATIDRFESLQEPFLPIRVLHSPSDEEIRDIVCSSTVTVYLSDGEGFGVPPLESLAVSVPVIVSANVPSLESIPIGGQVRLEQNTPDELTRALKRFADRNYALQMRKQAEATAIPTWRQFVDASFAWVDETLSATEATLSLQRNPTIARQLQTELHDYLPMMESQSANIHQQTETILANLFEPSTASAPTGLAPTEGIAGTARSLAAGLKLLYQTYAELQHVRDNVRESRHILFQVSADAQLRSTDKRNPIVADGLNKAIPVLSAFLNDSYSPGKFIEAAFESVLGERPPIRELEAQLVNLGANNSRARDDLFLNLLTSDPGIRRWSEHPYAWSFLMAYFGVETPLWATATSLFGKQFPSRPMRKPTFDRGRRFPEFASAAQRMASGTPIEWLPMMSVGAAAERSGGVVRAKAGVSGHLVFGPFFKLPPGSYVAQAEIQTDKMDELSKHPFLVAEAVAKDPETYLTQHDLEYNGPGQHQYALPFEISRAARRIEIRIWTSACGPIVIRSLTIRRVIDDNVKPEAG